MRISKISLILLMAEILHHLGCINLVNNGINYLSTGVGFQPSTVSCGKIRICTNIYIYICSIHPLKTSFVNPYGIHLLTCFSLGVTLPYIALSQKKKRLRGPIGGVRKRESPVPLWRKHGKQWLLILLDGPILPATCRECEKLPASQMV